MRNPVLHFYGINRTQNGKYYKLTLIEDREDDTKRYFAAFVPSDQVKVNKDGTRADVTINIKMLEFKEATEEVDPSLPF